MGAKKKLFLLNLVCVFAVLGFFYHVQTGRFREDKLLPTASRPLSWDRSSEDTEHIKAVLSQPFFFLGKGTQSYAFVSSDGNYVLKFFRPLRPSVVFHVLGHRISMHFHHIPYAAALFSLWNAEKVRETAAADFQSYILAYDQLKEETGVKFLHLNATEDLGTKIIFYDRLHIKHEVDADRSCFLLQKRAEPLSASIETLLNSGEIARVKILLQELVDLLGSRAKKGIYDRDTNILANFGCINFHPIQIDLGSFCEKEIVKSSEIYQKEILRTTKRLRKWLEKKNPSLAFFLLEEIALVKIESKEISP